MAKRDPEYFTIRRYAFGILILLVVSIAIYVAVGRGPNDIAPSAPAPEAAPSEATKQQAARKEDTGPSFDVVRISRSGTGVIAGRAAPGATVEVYADQKLVGTVTAGTNGEWVMILTEPLDSGPAELSLTAHMEGQSPTESKDIVVLSVPERPKERFVESQAEGVVALLTPRSGNGPSRVLQRPGATPVEEVGVGLGIDTLDYDENGKATITGRAPPSTELAVYVDNVLQGTVRADENRRWVLSISEPLAEGNHTLRVDQVIEGGNVELRLEQPFDTRMALDTSSQAQQVFVKPGNNLWHIARLIYGSGFRYTLIFQENADQIRDPDLIYPGQVFTLPSATRRAQSSVN